MAYYLKLSCILFVLSSCNQKGQDFDELLSSFVDKNCSPNSECVVSISNITGFDWEAMYVFSSAVSLEEIEQILGMRLSSYSDVADRIVFISGKEVVYHKEWFNNPSSPPTGVAFDIDKNSKKYTTKNATFKVNRVNELIVLSEKEK